MDEELKIICPFGATKKCLTKFCKLYDNQQEDCVFNSIKDLPVKRIIEKRRF